MAVGLLFQVYTFICTELTWVFNIVGNPSPFTNIEAYSKGNPIY